MRFALPLIIGALAVAGAGSALVEWRDAAALGALESSTAESIVLEQEIAALRSAAEVVVGSGVAHARLSARIRFLAERTPEPKARLALFCEALEAVGEAVRREPTNAAFLINWANLRQLLGRVDCANRFTAGDFRPVAAAALAADPTNTRVLYAAAQLAGWTGDTEELDRLLSRFLTLNVSMKASESEFVFSNLGAGDRVARIIPPRFPHVVVWARTMRTRNPELYRELSSVWAELQLAAMDESKAEVTRGAIPLDLHQRRLFEVVDIAPEPRVQQRADRELAEILTRAGNLTLGSYFAVRGGLEEIPVVRAVQRSDTRPGATSLVLWGHDDIAVFDEFFTSVGFYVPRGLQPRIVELLAAPGGGRLEPAAIQVLASNDNATWNQLSDRVKTVPLTLGELSGVALQLDGGSFRYWKVHFGSAERSRSFRNSLAKLVRVYGVRWND